MSVSIERTVVYERKEEGVDLGEGLTIPADVTQIVTTDCVLTPVEISQGGHTVFLRPEDVGALWKVVSTVQSEELRITAEDGTTWTRAAIEALRHERNVLQRISAERQDRIEALESQSGGGV